MIIDWSLTYELPKFVYVLISNLNEFNISLKTTNSVAFYLLVVLISIIQS